MTQNLKIEVLTGDISIDGMVVTNLVTKEELSTAIVKKADLGTDGKILTSQLPAEIVNTAGIVDEVKLQLETSIKDAVDESNAYAESYTDNALSSKADLTSGKVPLEQLPTIDQYPQFGTALSNLSTSILSAMKQRTDQLEKSKADLGEDGKVLREQIPSYEKISGLPEQLEVMSTQTAAVSRELDEHKLQTADQIYTLNENIEANVQQLTDRQSHLMRTYATKELGVDAKVGVKPGEYFNVRSSDEDEMLVEYQNAGGSAVATGKSYPSSVAVRNIAKYAALPFIAGKTYGLHESVVLANGDIVKSTVAGNTANPNVDMTGWVRTSDQIILDSISELPLVGYNFKSVVVKSYHLNLNLGGGIFYWDATGNKNTHNGGTVIDPTKAFPADWNDRSQLTTWFTANSSGLGVWRKVLSKDPNILDFGAIGDGTTDDTKAIQAAVSSGLKKVIVSEGVSTIYKLTDSIRISTPGLTLSWDSNLIKFKKFYSPLGSTPPAGGSLISVAAAAILLENVGLDGNANNYGGCGIVYESAIIHYTYGCRITNPDIRNTKDSCVIFKGSRGAPDIVISGGTMFTWQNPAYAGASSCGYPAIRIVGELDTGGPAPRVFDGVNASATILLDATGMNSFKVDNCFTGTILYQGNPDVTGGVDPRRTGQGAVTNTYVRDGLVIAGFENSVDTSLSHGHAPLVWDKYGGKPTVFSTFGWEISANSVITKLGPSNVVIYQIKDNSPQGLATLSISSLYTEEIPFSPEWRGSTSNPSINNGSLACAYDNVGKFINFRMKLTIGSTTSMGTGDWSFTLPRWANIAFGGHGVWSGYIVGVGRMSGAVVIYNNGAVHEIALLSSDGSTVIGSGNPASLPAGSTFLVSFHYLRG